MVRRLFRDRCESGFARFYQRTTDSLTENMTFGRDP